MNRIYIRDSGLTTKTIAISGDREPSQQNALEIFTIELIARQRKVYCKDKTSH